MKFFQTVREFFLEKKVLYFLFCNIPQMIDHKEKEKENLKKNEEECKQNKIKIIENFSSIDKTIDMKNKLNPFEKNLLIKKNSEKIEKFLSCDIFNNFDKDNYEKDIEEEKRGTDCVENEQKIKKSIPLISNKIKLDNNAKTSDNKANPLNNNIIFLDNNIKSQSNENNNDKDNYSNDINKRNHSNILNLELTSDKEKLSFHSIANLNNDSPKELRINNPKLQKKEKSFILPYNKNSAKELNLEKSEKKIPIDLNLRKCPSETCKFNSNKLVFTIGANKDRDLAFNSMMQQPLSKFSLEFENKKK